jgi:hypothetical protein
MLRDILFIVDGRYIGVTDMSALDREYQKFTAVLTEIARAQFPLEASDSIWNAEVCDKITLTELLWGKERGRLDRDLSILLQQALDRFHFSDMGGFGSEKYAEEHLRNLRAAALVVSLAHEKIQNLDRGLVLHYVGTKEALTEFYRAVPLCAKYGESEFMELLPYAFPRLFFHEKLDMGKFNEEYPAIREKLLDALSYLNDRFYEALHECGNQPDKVERDFKTRSRGLGGIGRETAKTMQVYGRQREVSVQGKSVSCEWHIKLRPHIDRIHFAYEEKYKNVADGRIIVGIFVSHLNV